MGHTKEQSVSIMTDNKDEELAGYNCPECGYPIAIEMGLELCYCCGWAKDEEELGHYDE